MKKHVNIPVFVPHLGCPNTCVFCNQHIISGKEIFSFDGVKAELDAAFATVDRQTTEAEIAFFGGSFTGIDKTLMESLLQLAQTYVDKQLATAIRLSTRPDYISPQILDILSRYTVKTVELGIQSCSDRVLSACSRGHTFGQTKEAVELLRAYGFGWTGQMMIGLPGSTAMEEAQTAKFICENGAESARIYPTVVFRDTALQQMIFTGDYQPLSAEEAVERSARVLEIFVENEIPVLRIGLHASEQLSDADTAVAGANHPAIGEMVMSRLYLHRMRKLLSENGVRPGASVTFSVARGATSKALGQHGENRQKLCEEFSIKSVKVVENPEIILYNIKLV